MESLFAKFGPSVSISYDDNKECVIYDYTVKNEDNDTMRFQPKHSLQDYIAIIGFLKLLSPDKKNTDN